MPQNVLEVLPKLTVTSVIDILLVAILIYNFLSMLRGRRAIHVMSGLGALAITYWVATWLKLDLLRSVLAYMAPYTPIALIIMFQSEIRATLARFGRIRIGSLGGRLHRREIVDDILLAVEEMAEARTGALIVLEGDIGLRTFIESGVSLDARVSRDLLCAIFHVGAELHDGAVIIQGERIAAAACFLPLHTLPAFKKMGTRHRAAIGVTEESDALAVVISEETGGVSIGYRGELEADISMERLQERLIRHSTGSRAKVASPREPEFGRAEL